MSAPHKDPLPYVPYEDHLMDVEQRRERSVWPWLAGVIAVAAAVLWIVL